MQNQNQPPVLSIKMVPAGVELVLAGLNKLPREQSDGLFQEIVGQANFQLQELQKAHEAEQERLALAEKEAAAKAAADAAAGSAEEVQA